MTLGDCITLGVVTIGFMGQAAALVYIARLTCESIPIGRVVAALVYPEEDNARALIRDLGRPGPA